LDEVAAAEHPLLQHQHGAFLGEGGAHRGEGRHFVIVVFSFRRSCRGAHGSGGPRSSQVAADQAKTAAERHAEQTKADRERRITESFVKAVEQLGSDKPALVRLRCDEHG
jgi:hypothetical protein